MSQNTSSSPREPYFSNDTTQVECLGSKMLAGVVGTELDPDEPDTNLLKNVKMLK